MRWPLYLFDWQPAGLFQPTVPLPPEGRRTTAANNTRQREEEEEKGERERERETGGGGALRLLIPLLRERKRKESTY